MNSKEKHELIYSIIVVVILLALAALNFSYIVHHKPNVAQPLNNAEVPTGSTVINVTGYQWAWTFTYGNGSSSTDYLYVTANHSYTLQVTSKDVIHDLLIPSMGVQVYAVPGHPNQVTFEPTHAGKYIFECVEYCGQDHYLMRGYMEVSA